ncbi:MAG TPA: histidine--tRNA ligase [Gammaproteobacteria bacterium]|nr:histidine--tRNA ligase [Gammaproteobacteria bacterium]
MAELIQPVRGMNDVLPDEAPLWSRLESSAAALFASYGYRRIRIPVLERTELFSRSIGDETDIVAKEMYTFADRNGESMTLRPEATAGVVRACLSNGLLHNQQQKLWCSGPMFRYEKPQKGRYRQFHQLSVEALGYAEPEIDAELIAMSARLWKELGIASATLEMNSLGTPESRAGYRQALVDYFGRHREALDEDSLRRLERNPLRILDSKNPAVRELIADAPLLSDYLDDESRAHFDRVQQLLSDVGVAFTLNPRLVRGLDYYSRTVFEWLTDRLGAQSAICSGGRYDGLVAHLGGRDTPAVGWALGIERIVELARAEGVDGAEPAADAFLIAAGDAPRRRGFELAERLRDRLPGLKLSIGSPAAGFKAQLRRADKSGARYALILGDAEIAADRIAVKPLREDRPQELMTLDDCVRLLGAALRSA